jgi:hypothetical protein
VQPYAGAHIRNRLALENDDIFGGVVKALLPREKNNMMFPLQNLKYITQKKVCSIVYKFSERIILTFTL